MQSNKYKKRVHLKSNFKKTGNISKTTRKIINKETKDTPHFFNEINLSIDGEFISDPFVVSEKFNDYFVNVVKNVVVPKLPSNVIEPSSYINLVSKFHTVRLSESELDEIITSFEIKYSVGWDKVPMPIIKHSKCYFN